MERRCARIRMPPGRAAIQNKDIPTSLTTIRWGAPEAAGAVKST